MGIWSWIVAILLFAIALGILGTVFNVAKRIIHIHDKDRNTGDTPSGTPLIIGAVLGAFATILIMVSYFELPSVSKNTKLFMYFSGIILYLTVFIGMFFVGRSYTGTKRPFTNTQILAGLGACLIPFMMLMLAGNSVILGALKGEDRTQSFGRFILFVVLLTIPSVCGVFGSGVLGKMASYN